MQWTSRPTHAISLVARSVRKKKQRLTRAEKAEKKRKRELYMTIFVRGKMKRVLRPPTIEGVPAEDFIAANADPIWLHQNEMWEDMPIEDQYGAVRPIMDCHVGVYDEEPPGTDEPASNDGDYERRPLGDDEIPF